MTMPAKGSATYGHYVAQIVDYLVQEKVVAQSAKQLGVSVSDKDVNDQIAQIEKSYGGEKKLLSLLTQQGMTMELLKRSIRSQTLAQRAASVVSKKATVSDAQIQAYWKAHKAQYLTKKKTNTFAKASATIKHTLLSAKQQQLWSAWLSGREKVLGVAYAGGYDPAQLTASPSASASSSGG
jgi:parvulin-like peptidyl-prolyl isomerase